MTNNAGSRHAAQGRASRIAGRAALGVLGAPIAMLAVAGPAGAASLELDGVLVEDGLDIQLAANDVSVPSLDSSALPALPAELPTELPAGTAFEGVPLDLLDLGGAEALALPTLPAVDSLPLAGALAAVPVALPTELPALPAADDLALPALPVELPALPAAGDLALPALPVELPALPAADDLALPALPSTDALPALPDVAGTVTGLAGGLPTASNLDLDAVTAAVPAADVFSATDLVSGLI